MGIRQTVNEHPRLTTALTAGVLFAVLVLVIWQFRPPAGPPPQPKQAWFTEDDGQTKFADDYGKYAPFTGPNGGEAVRAHVYRVGKGPEYVGYLEKYDAEAKKILDEFYADSANDGKYCPQQRTFLARNLCVKKPQDEKWLHIAKQPAEVMAVRNPPVDERNLPIEVFPDRK